MGAEQLWLTWGQTLPFSFTQVSPALNTKQHLELDINDVFYRDNGQLSIAQHFPKAQSRDFLCAVHCCPNQTGTSITV